MRKCDFVDLAACIAKRGFALLCCDRCEGEKFVTMMNSVDSAHYSQVQSASTPSSETPDSRGIVDRYPGEKSKMSNSTPNGYNVSNYKVKSDDQSKKHHHDVSRNSDHKHSNSSHHNSDHAKKKEGDSSKLSTSSKPKDSLNKVNKSSNDIQKSKDHHHEKKHEHSKSSSEKLKKSSSDKSSHDGLKKVDKHREDKHKEKPKDGHSSDHKHKDKTKDRDRTKDDKLKDPSKVKKFEGHKEKHSDKPKDKLDKSKSDKLKDKSDRPKEKSGDKPKEKSDKSKDKTDKPKEKSDKPKEKSDKPKEKSDKLKDKSDKPKERSDKPKDKGDKPKDKSKDKVAEKPKDKSFDDLKDKKRESSPEKKTTPLKDHSKIKGLEIPKIKQEPISPPRNIKLEIDSPLSSPVKEETFSDDDVPLSSRKPSREAAKPIKREVMDEESDDEPLSARISKAKKVKIEKSTTKKRKADSEDEDYEDYDSDYKKPKKKVKKETKAAAKKTPIKNEETASPKKRGKKEEEQDVWKWWEEEKPQDGAKWRTLDHKGPVFAPPYERVPKQVKFYYDGKAMELSEVTEEVAGFYGRMLDHDYTSKEAFNTNFFKDWRKVMTPQEREVIKDLKKCNFKDFDVYYKQKSEERKNMSKEEKQKIKQENAQLTEEYGFCIIDGHRQKIGNFKIEPPGLFRGRGEHPKMGMLKRRVQPEDILINIGRESKVPDPPAGHKWKEIRHDNTVTWLASWNENILNSTKYIMLNPSSKLKGEKDWQKYETARKLKDHAGRIRNTYQQDFKSKEMKVRQRAVALYFIDKLALRAGNEKDEDTADTVGCCSLRVEHITLDEERDGQEYVVSFDFLGKDSIRYVNTVPVEKRAFKNLKLFMENKQPGDDLFDRLNTSILNKYLTELMEGLTAKVFRTYNASKTLQEQLDLLTKEEMSVPEKLLAYNRANRAVAVLCNHQRAVPKTFDKSMENLKNKIDEKMQQIKTVKKELKQLKSDAKNSGASKDKVLVEKKKKRLQQLEEQLQKLEVQATDKEENKQIALGTSKLNYLDPRISVAWCKKWNVPIEKIYNRTQRDKFRWAIEMAGPEFSF